MKAGTLQQHYDAGEKNISLRVTCKGQGSKFDDYEICIFCINEECKASLVLNLDVFTKTLFHTE